MKMERSSAAAVQMHAPQAGAATSRAALTQNLRQADGYDAQIQMLAPEDDAKPDPIAGKLGTVLALLARAMCGGVAGRFTPFDKQGGMKWQDAINTWTGELQTALDVIAPTAKLDPAALFASLGPNAPVDLDTAKGWARGAAVSIEMNDLVTAWQANGGHVASDIRNQTIQIAPR